MEKTREKVTIGFTGDLSFSGYFKGKETEDILSEEVKTFLAENDAAVINLESPITDYAEMTKIRLAHKSSLQTIDFLKKNFKNPVVSLANNHMMDFGRKGLEDTLKILKESNMPKIGAGYNLDDALKPVIIEKNGIKIAIAAIQYKGGMIASKEHCGPLHTSAWKKLRKKIKMLKSGVDWVVLVYHGGEEFLHTPMPYIRRQLKSYIDAGADTVVAHHPHTVQGYEQYKGKYIFYSLGNFIFDTDYQRIQADTEDGMLLNLTFDKENICFEELPVKISREDQRIAAREKDEYFRNLNDIDYEKAWHRAAYQKKIILKTGNELEKKELNELKQKGVVTEKQIQRPKGLRKIMKRIVGFISNPAETVHRAEKKLVMRKGRKAYKAEINEQKNRP